MKSIVPVISSLDAYGSLFSFTINRESKYKTFLGGMISLLSFLFIGSFTFLFGKDFFFRKNPKIVFVQENLSAQINRGKISNKNLTIAWRIEDTNRKQVSYTSDLFYTSIAYYSYIFSYEKNETIKIKKNIPVKKCNEIFAVGEFPDFLIDHNYLYYFNASEWNCVDFEFFDDIYLGGKAAENLDFERFEISLNTCEYDLINQLKTTKNTSSEADANIETLDFNNNSNITSFYNDKNNFSQSIITIENINLDNTNNSNNDFKSPKCSDIAKLRKSLLSETKYISILYPKAHYSFTNFKNPFTLIYKNYFTNLNLNLVKKDEMTLNFESFLDEVLADFRFESLIVVALTTYLLAE